MVMDSDFREEQDKSLAGLVDAVFRTNIGKNRRAHLTAKQAVALSRARAFAAMYVIPELDALCDVLADTTISVSGRGMKQLVSVLEGRMNAADSQRDKLDSMRLRGLG